MLCHRTRINSRLLLCHSIHIQSDLYRRAECYNVRRGTSSTYTSPTGINKEMRLAILIMIVSSLAGIILLLTDNIIKLDPDKCVGRGACSENCAFSAISVTPGVGCAADAQLTLLRLFKLEALLNSKCYLFEHLNLILHILNIEKSLYDRKISIIYL